MSLEFTLFLLTAAYVLGDQLAASFECLRCESRNSKKEDCRYEIGILNTIEQNETTRLENVLNFISNKNGSSLSLDAEIKLR